MRGAASLDVFALRELAAGEEVPRRPAKRAAGGGGGAGGASTAETVSTEGYNFDREIGTMAAARPPDKTAGAAGSDGMGRPRPVGPRQDGRGPVPVLPHRHGGDTRP